MTTSTGNLRKKKTDTKRISELSQIAELPRNQQILLEILLISPDTPYTQLCTIATQLPGDNALAQADVDSALYELLRVGYLVSFMENGDIFYMVQLKGKREKRDEQRLWRDLGLGTLYDQIKGQND